MTQIKEKEIVTIEFMLRHDNLRDIERYVLNAYLKSLRGNTDIPELNEDEMYL